MLSYDVGRDPAGANLATNTTTNELRIVGIKVLNWFTNKVDVFGSWDNWLAVVLDRWKDDLFEFFRLAINSRISIWILL